MKRLHMALGALALVAISLAVVAWVSTFHGGTSPHKTTDVAAKTASRDVSATATASAPASPAATATASPGPPPDPYLHSGSEGPDVLALQQRLASLTYMVGTADGKFGGGTRDGLVAFQKVNGLKTTGEADPPTAAKLAAASAPSAAYATPANHVEVDIAHQVVYVVRGGVVANTLTTSTGSNQLFTSEGWTRRAVTPNGVFQVYWKIPAWHKAPLGNLYKPSFFNGGIAFHGYYEVPTYPASHGCIRLPMEFADWFYDSAAPMGSTVYVYGGPSGPNPAPAPETSMATIPPPAPGAAASPSPSPTPVPSPSPSASGGCLTAFLGMSCPTPAPTPTPSPSTTPAPTPTPSLSPTSTPTPTPTATGPGATPTVTAP